jgi:polysaccharide pyruvyl transferase WcaK-like protein
VECWAKTGKPYGFFGIGFTLAGEAAGVKFDSRIQKLLIGSKFVFTRETASLANLKTARVEGPRTGFAPDGTFSFDIRDEQAANRFIGQSGLAGPFIAVVPRLRFTPYHRIRKTPNYGPEEAKRRDEFNDRHAEADHAKVREVIVAWVKKTGGKVLLCPEMTYQLEILEPLLYNPLPAEIKRNVIVRRTYWLPDEAASIYQRAAAVISMECHSPIIAATSGTPCIYVHQPEDGIKGHMWQDIGLGDWYFEVEKTTGEALAARVLEISADAKARAKTVDAVKFARRKQDEAMETVKASF